MSLNLAGIQKHFKRLGKAIFVSQQAQSMSDDLKKSATGVLAQEVAASTAGYPSTAEGSVPLYTNIKAAVVSADGLKANAKSAVDTMLRNVIAVDLGLARGATAAVTCAALIAAMDDVSATVAASGGSPDGFASYFSENYSAVLPIDGSPNVLDAWVDDDVV